MSRIQGSTRCTVSARADLPPETEGFTWTKANTHRRRVNRERTTRLARVRLELTQTPMSMPIPTPVPTLTAIPNLTLTNRHLRRYRRVRHPPRRQSRRHRRIRILNRIAIPLRAIPHPPRLLQAIQLAPLPMPPKQMSISVAAVGTDRLQMLTSTASSSTTNRIIKGCSTIFFRVNPSSRTKRSCVRRTPHTNSPTETTR